MRRMRAKSGLKDLKSTQHSEKGAVQAIFSCSHAFLSTSSPSSTFDPWPDPWPTQLSDIHPRRLFFTTPSDLTNTSAPRIFRACIPVHGTTLPMSSLPQPPSIALRRPFPKSNSHPSPIKHLSSNPPLPRPPSRSAPWFQSLTPNSTFPFHSFPCLRRCH
jgi:hypothetical protein